MTAWIHPEWLRHDIRDVGCFIATCAIIANFMPRIAWVDAKMQKYPKLRGPIHDFYVWLVDMVAFCGCNWRAQVPSMDFQWFGFARAAKHSYRNWQETRMSRRYLRDS